MTSNEFVPVETAAERYGIAKEKLLNQVLQKVVRIKDCDGYVGLSVDDLDAIYVNDKAKHNGGARTTIKKKSSGEPFSREEIATLIENYWTDTHTELVNRFPTRTSGSVSAQTSRLMALRKLPRNPPGCARTKVMAKRLRIGQNAIADAALAGKIRGLRKGGVWYVNVEDCIARWGSAQESVATPTAKMEEPAPLAAPIFIDAKTAGIRIGTSSVFVTEECRKGNVPGAYMGKNRTGGNKWFIPEAWVEGKEQSKINLEQTTLAPPAPPTPLRTVAAPPEDDERNALAAQVLKIGKERDEIREERNQLRRDLEAAKQRLATQAKIILETGTGNPRAIDKIVALKAENKALRRDLDGTLAELEAARGAIAVAEAMPKRGGFLRSLLKGQLA